MRTAALLLALLFLLGSPTGDAAERPILTVSGALSSAAPLQLTFSDLERMGTETIRTKTDWTTGVQDFEGVPLRRFLEAVGARGTTMHMTALNGYMSELPLADAAKYRVILALRMNGERMTVRNKGPIWVIYADEGQPEIHTQEIRARMAWQLVIVEIR
jgi:hypothetical protein